MDWNEFFERYTTNHEEFKFKYKEFVIDLLYSSDGKKFAYYIKEYIKDETLWQYIKNRNKYLESKVFDSPQELLNNFRIDGKSFKDIWDDLEWK